jgi:DNA-binding response OmpR family regulator
MARIASQAMASAHVLVVDDEDDLREVVCTLLRRAGLAATGAPNGREALRALFDARPDLVVLDAAMPVLDGWQTLERIREVTDLPVLMLTASDAELEKVRGLRAGADDYVTKPFGRQELVARVEALLRRAKETEVPAEAYSDGLIGIDYADCTVTVDGEQVGLTPTEYRLLCCFVRHPNQVLSREQILELVWDQTFGGPTDQVKVYVGYLRRKLAEATDEMPIETVRGFGYRYRRPETTT